MRSLSSAAVHSYNSLVAELARDGAKAARAALAAEPARVAVGVSTGRGLGVFAARDLAPGELCTEYDGLVVGSSALDALATRRLARGYFGADGYAEGLDRILSLDGCTLFGAAWRGADADARRAAQIVNDGCAGEWAAAISRAEAMSAVGGGDAIDKLLDGGALLDDAAATAAADAYVARVGSETNVAMVALADAPAAFDAAPSAAFAVATREVRAGDELAWTYSLRWWAARYRRAARAAVVGAALATAGGDAADEATAARALSRALSARGSAARAALRGVAGASARAVDAEQIAVSAARVSRSVGALEELESVDEYVWRYFLLARARATREGPHEQAAALARLPAEELVPPWERVGSTWLVK